MNQVVPFQIWRAVLCVLAGYLLGNIQTAIIVSKRYYHDDVRNYGSGNAGSTNMLRVFGVRPGLVTFVGDFVKGVLGVLAGWLLMGTYGGYIAGFFVVLGHCFPAFSGWRGGKGVASSLGVGLMVCPLGAGCAAAVGVILLAITKKVSIMSLSGILAFFVYTLIFCRDDVPLIILAAIIFVLVYVRHWENIKRIIRGEEFAPIEERKS